MGTISKVEGVAVFGLVMMLSLTILAADAQESATASNPIKMSDSGFQFLKETERLRLIPYDDQTGKSITHWVRGATIGYGYLISIHAWPEYKNGISEEQAVQLFKKTISPFEKTVDDNIHVPLASNQFDALTLLVYNIGIGAFRSSSVVKLINNPNDPRSHYPTLEKAWKAFDRSEGKIDRGLINRRQAEYDMYTRNIYKHW